MYFPYTFRNIDVDRIDTIELYDMTEAEDKSINLVTSTTPFSTLPRDRNKEFIDAMKEIKFYYLFVLAPVEPVFHCGGYVVKINYIDGSYKLMDSDFVFADRDKK